MNHAWKSSPLQGPGPKCDGDTILDQIDKIETKAITVQDENLQQKWNLEMCCIKLKIY